MANGCRHPPHLAIAAFAQGQFEPAIGHALAKAHRRHARPQVWRIDAPCPSRQRHPVFQPHAALQRIERSLVRLSFHLHQIGLACLETGIGNPRLQGQIQPDPRTSKERFQITADVKACNGKPADVKIQTATDTAGKSDAKKTDVPAKADAIGKGAAAKEAAGKAAAAKGGATRMAPSKEDAARNATPKNEAAKNPPAAADGAKKAPANDAGSKGAEMKRAADKDAASKAAAASAEAEKEKRELQRPVRKDKEPAHEDE